MQQKIMSRSTMLSVNPRISQDLQNRNVYFKRCTVGKVYSFGNTYSREKFFQRKPFCISQIQHQNLIKVMHIWCSSWWFVTPSAFSEPFTKAISWNYLQHLCPCTNRWKRHWVLLLDRRTPNSTQGNTFTASKTHIRKVLEVSSEA